PHSAHLPTKILVSLHWPESGEQFADFFLPHQPPTHAVPALREPLRPRGMINRLKLRFADRATSGQKNRGSRSRSRNCEDWCWGHFWGVGGSPKPAGCTGHFLALGRQSLG